MAREREPVRVAAIILNFRTPDLVLANLESLLPAVDPERDAVVIVDNASGDDSVPRIAEAIDRVSWSRLHLVESPRNGGFAAGNNAGIRSIEASAYLLLNSDTVVRPGAIDLLWRALDSDPAIGIVGPRLEGLDGRPQVSCFRLHSPWSEFMAGSATGPLSRALHRHRVPLPISDQPFAPEWISFAAAMIRSEVVRDIGPLDEGFFMFYEDADYCRRASAAGWRIWHEPRARVVHLRGRSSPVKRLTASGRRRPAYYYASRSRFFRKAFGRRGPLLANLAWTLGRSVSFLRERFGSKRRHTVERELLDIWSH